MFNTDKMEEMIGACAESEEMLNGEDELSRLIRKYVNGVKGDLSEEELDQVTGGTRDIYVRIKERIDSMLIQLAQ